jgi:hypothetical protein
MTEENDTTQGIFVPNADLHKTLTASQDNTRSNQRPSKTNEATDTKAMPSFNQSQDYGLENPDSPRNRKPADLASNSGSQKNG